MGLNRLTERSQPAMSMQLSHGETVALPAGTWRYEHDGLGRRTSKVELDAQDEPIESTRVRYLYGPEGLLHGETAPGGTTLASVYIWLNGEPIGLIRNDTLYHIHPDHLGRPEVITDASRNVVWRAVLHPWDHSVATSSIGAYNLGFPGQYRDSESAQWYNWFRTYDGSIGRYTQADPIGLAGGLNTYLYANANPVSFVDPYGLFPCLTNRQIDQISVATGAGLVGGARGAITGLRYGGGLGAVVLGLASAARNASVAVTADLVMASNSVTGSGVEGLATTGDGATRGRNFLGSLVARQLGTGLGSGETATVISAALGGAVSGNPADATAAAVLASGTRRALRAMNDCKCQ